MSEILFSNVCKQFDGQQVLSSFTVSIPLGQNTAVMGPSGSGKTVFTRLLTGLEKPDSGTILFPEKVRFSCVFQEYCLCPGLSAIENVALVLPRGQKLDWASVFAKVGLTLEDIQKPCEELSGGQKQRVALVRALEGISDIVVLDEAFKGLDQQQKQQAYNYVKNNLRGRTLVLVTHSMPEAEFFCENIIEIAESVPYTLPAKQ